MNQTEAHKIARALMDDAGLQDWGIVFNNNKTRLGACNYRKHCLMFSLAFLNDDFIDTVKHEMAHAIVGPSAGHGPVWKAAVSRMGGTAKSSAKVAPKGAEFYKYYGICPCGKAKKGFHRRPRSFAWTCNICKGALLWKMDGKPMQEVKRNPEFVPSVRTWDGPVKRSRREVYAGRGRNPYDRGFVDIEALWDDPK